jgi:hydrogenase nickel incorporation protein HypA/HybF
MHEMGIALEIIDIVRSSIPADKPDARVERINLKLGKLSAVVADSLRFCFEVAAKEAGLGGAELVIDEIPVTACCNSCGHTWTIEKPVFVCPACDHTSIEMLSGRELDIESIEILEEGDEPHANQHE